MARIIGAPSENRAADAPVARRTGREIESRPQPGTRPGFPVYGVLMLVWALFFAFMLPVLIEKVAVYQIEQILSTF